MKPEFLHRFLPGDHPRITLLLLHGTGGDENDLLPLGRMLAPGAAVLSPRGKVLENGMPRFFRRLSEGVFDLEDLKFRANELAAFISAAAGEYHFPPVVYAAGFSNGANIAAAVLLLHPEVLAGAILLRPMVPLVPEKLPDLARKPVLIAAGRNDPIVRPGESQRLAELLSRADADVTLEWQPGGHSILQGDIDAAVRWMRERA